MSLWIVKHRPKALKELVGCGAASTQLVKWLTSWNPRTSKRGMVISGPCGVGKSVLAELACQEARIPNYLVLDSTRKRTKKALQELGDAFGTRKVDAYMLGKMQRSKPGAVVVDDMDAMVTSDRGGVAQIVAFLKASKVPTVCVLNDPTHRAFTNLLRVCEHIRIGRPTPDQVVPLLLGVAKAEGVKPPLQASAARSLIIASGCDVRQAITELQFASLGGGALAVPKNEGGCLIVDRPLGLFEILPSLFKVPLRGQGFRPLAQIACLGDVRMNPMLVQENYVDAKQKSFDAFVAAADAISLGDVAEGMSRRTSCAGGEWGSIVAVIGTALPCSLLSTPLNGRPRFPAVLGKASSITKAARDLELLAKHMGPRYGGRELAVHQVGYLSRLLVEPLEVPGAGIGNVAPRAKQLGLKIEDWDLVRGLGEMGSGHRAVPASTRTALSKALADPPATKRRGKKGAEPPAKKAKLEEEEEEEDTDLSDDQRSPLA
jgi:hypothetical protein